MPKPGEEWTVVTKGHSLLLIKNDKGELRSPTEDEAKQAANFLNEQGSYTQTIYCRNANCKDKGSWIRRSREDIKKNVYTCEVCQHPMVP